MSFLFLGLLLAILEAVRQGRRAWLLWTAVPVMLLWVNMHGLFFFGPVLLWTGLVCAAIDRRLGRQSGNLGGRSALWPVLAASVMCLASPWPLETVTHPFTLATRLTNEQYTGIVGELHRTMFFLQQEPRSYWGVALLTVLAVVACAVRWGRLPLAHAVWLVMFGTLGWIAQRNTALMGMVCGYLLLVHLGPAWRQTLHPRLRGLNGKVKIAAAAALIVAAVWVPGDAMLSRWRTDELEWGWGMQPCRQMSQTAAMLARAPQDGDVVCINFADAGVVLYHEEMRHDPPHRRVWMDAAP